MQTKLWIVGKIRKYRFGKITPSINNSIHCAFAYRLHKVICVSLIIILLTKAFTFEVYGMSETNYKNRYDMKLKLGTRSILFLLPLIGLGCSALNRDANSLYINETIGRQSKMSIELEDKSGFNMDLQTTSNDTLFLERQGLDKLSVTKATIAAIIQPNTSAAILNNSNRNIKVRVRVHDHKSKVIYKIQGIKN
jgi:hypothetical protein